MDIELPNDFKEFLKLLNSHEVKYLVVGGYAVGYHGYPRATNDLDVWVAIAPENARQLVQVLTEFGFNVPDLSEALFLISGKVIRMGLPPVRIELLTSASGVDFEPCYRERLEVEWGGVPVKFISLDRLKMNKRASGRHKDLDDLEHLP